LKIDKKILFYDMLKKIISNSEQDSANFAVEIAKTAKPGSVFALYGLLGAGKSVFSRSFARACGVKGPIPSPTFTIVQEYKIDETIYGFKRLYHMDLYRIPDSENALAFGIDEFLDDNSAIKLIEWPERIEDILPPDTLQIKIDHLEEEKREITLSSKKTKI
jgi:tRNA threonylcarbamoyladenosine biosynthesis protein TsaE